MLERVWKSFLRRKSPSIWSAAVPFLWVASMAYRLGQVLDRALSGRSTSVKVPLISVGNITVGGTGKTPMVAFLAAELLKLGLRVGIASSGYGRESDEPVSGDGLTVARLDASVVGDETKVLASMLPAAQFAVDRLKLSAAETLSTSGLVDVIIVDDGFQHYRLRRDLDVVVFDATIPIRNLRLLPLGLLREPISALKRADVVVLMRPDDSESLLRFRDRLSQISPQLKLYTGRFVSQELITRSRRFSVNYLKDKRVFLFAGIGNFEPLKTAVSTLSGELVCALELADHQRYDTTLLSRIKGSAEQHRAEILVTTGKDWVKLGDFDFGMECCYLEHSAEVDADVEPLISWIRMKLQLRTETS